MEAAVLVIVGDWECSDGGEWHFKVSKDVFGKCVDVGEKDNYENVRDKVVDAFGINLVKQTPFLSFWSEEEAAAVFTQMRMPPVAIDMDSGLGQFKQNFLEKRGLNMFLTINKCTESGDYGGEVGMEVEGDETWMRLNSPKVLQDGRMLEAVDEAIVGYGSGRSRQVNESLLMDETTDLFAVPVTYEDEEFIRQVDEMFRLVERGDKVAKDNVNTVMDVNGKRKRDVCINNGNNDSLTEDYDFDQMGYQIEQDYPTNWDPENPLGVGVEEVLETTRGRGGVVVTEKVVVDDDGQDDLATSHYVNRGLDNNGGEDRIHGLPDEVVVAGNESGGVRDRDTSTIGIVHGHEPPAIGLIPIGFTLGLGDDGQDDARAEDDGQDDGPAEVDGQDDDPAEDDGQDDARAEDDGQDGACNDFLCNDFSSQLVMDDDLLLMKDSRPYRHNASGVAKEKAHMNLRKA